MAKTRSDQPRRLTASKLLVWVLLALLLVGLAGFSITSFGGGATTVGRVGDRTITVDDYVSALRAEMNSFSQQVGQPITFAQAQMFGIDRQAQLRLATEAALDGETDRIGVSAGDARVLLELRDIAGFQGAGGTFDPETYRFVLERNNLRPAEFETDIREDLARTLLQGAVGAGFAAPEGLVAPLFAYVGERRGFSLLRLTEADLAEPLPEPDDAALRAHYDANIASFTRPEARRITYATLLPADLASTMALDEATLRKAYDDRIAEFVQPERRLVERLIYPDDAAAAAAKARIDAGESFETLVADRGLTLTDVDLGDVSRADLGPAGDGVFALAEPGVAGPLPTDLGPALFRMNGILPAQEITFEEARDALSAELAADAARRAIQTRREALVDLLASGATIEDLARDEGMQAGTVDYYDGTDAEIAGYQGFRAVAAGLAEGDYPQLIELDDGGVAVVQLQAILPPEPRPFDTVRDAVAEGWRTAELARRLSDRAVAIKAEVEGGASLGSLGILEVTARTARDGFVEGAPPALMQAVFEMEAGQVRVIEGPEFTALVRLDSVAPADAADPALAALRTAIAAQAETGLGQDAQSLFTQHLLNSAGVFFDEAALNAVHAQMQ